MILPKDYREDDKDLDIITRMCNDILNDDRSSMSDKIAAATVRANAIDQRYVDRMYIIRQLF